VSTLLHISASPRGESSESLAVAAEFIRGYRRVRPEAEVTTWDLWDGSLPEFGPAATAAKMAVFAGSAPDGEAARAWTRVQAAFDRFAAAEEYLFSVPMWNAGVPYVLKQFIDVVSQPGLAFSFDPAQGYRGLLTGRRATVIYTSAVYGPDPRPGFGSDFQAPFFDDWLDWIGITEHTAITLRPDLVSADAATDRARARHDALTLGASS